MNLLPVGIHHNIPDSVYRADPGYNQSTLVDFITASSPLHFKTNQAKDKEELAEKDFIRIGSYVDCMLTEPGEVNNRFAITPALYPCGTKKEPDKSKPWSRGANYCKEWEAEQKESGRVCLTPTEYIRALGTIKALQAHEDTSAAIEFCHKQVVIIVDHPVFGYRLKGKLDFLPPAKNLHGDPGIPYILDIKTGESAQEDEVRRQCIRLMREFQARYYLNLVHWVAPADYGHIKGFALAVAETDEPHGVAIHTFELGYPELEYVQPKIDDALKRYDKCVTSGVWPGYSTDWKRIQYPDYITRPKR